MALLGQQVQLVHKERRGSRVRWARQVPQARQVQQVRRVDRVHKVHRDRRVRLQFFKLNHARQDNS